MYEQFYGLRERAFDLTANPRFLFLSSGHREALSNLRYGLTAHKGITLLVGEAGTGKTTLLRAAIEAFNGQPVALAQVINPTLTRAEFFDLLAHAFGLSPDAAALKSRFLRELTAAAEARRARGGITALVVDEAQSLPDELLEEVRLLANIESSTEKLVPVVLAGQPELADRLNAPGLHNLKQRVALRCSLPPLDLRETAAYIAKRIHLAGGNGAQIFTADAVRLIHERSHGVPRTISVICDNALVNGFALDRRPVDADLVLDVCRDFDFSGPGRLPREADASVARPRHASAPPPERHPLAPPTLTVRPMPASPIAPAEREPAHREPRPQERESGSELFSLFRRKRRFSFF